MIERNITNILSGRYTIQLKLPQAMLEQIYNFRGNKSGFSLRQLWTMDMSARR